MSFTQQGNVYGLNAWVNQWISRKQQLEMVVGAPPAFPLLLNVAEDEVLQELPIPPDQNYPDGRINYILLDNLGYAKIWRIIDMDVLQWAPSTSGPLFCPQIIYAPNLWLGTVLTAACPPLPDPLCSIVLNASIHFDYLYFMTVSLPWIRGTVVAGHRDYVVTVFDAGYLTNAEVWTMAAQYIDVEPEFLHLDGSEDVPTGDTFAIWPHDPMKDERGDR